MWVEISSNPSRVTCYTDWGSSCFPQPFQANVVICIVACLLKATIMKPAKTDVAKERLWNHTRCTINISPRRHRCQATIEKLILRCFLCCPCGSHLAGNNCHYEGLMIDPCSRQSGRPTSIKPKLSDSNKNLVLGPRWGSTAKTD
jgi:hypothetical protein